MYSIRMDGDTKAEIREMELRIEKSIMALDRRLSDAIEQMHRNATRYLVYTLAAIAAATTLIGVELAVFGYVLR